MIKPNWSRRIAQVANRSSINDLSFKSKYSFLNRIGKEDYFSDLSKSDQKKFIEYEKEFK